MIQTKERYVVDEQGNRQAVLLSIKDYQRLLEELEELETLRAYDAAAAAHDEAIPFEQAIAEIERAAFFEWLDTTAVRHAEHIAQLSDEQVLAIIEQARRDVAAETE